MLRSIVNLEAESSGWECPGGTGRYRVMHPSIRNEVSRLGDFTGDHYRTCLTRLHEILKPSAYLEIGSFHGDSQKLAKCATIAVDPQFQLEYRVPGDSQSALCLFQMRSDQFFKSYDPRAILGKPIDFAFLDGMHLLECLLRDFIHTERGCHSRSIIALHDCVPLDLYMAGRTVGDMKRRALSVHPTWWTGDVWKILLIFRQYRPDLTVEVLNAPPTGLVLVRGLDPNSGVLADHENEIIDRFRDPADERGLFDRFLSSLEPIDTRRLDEIIYKLPQTQRP